MILRIILVLSLLITLGTRLNAQTNNLTDDDLRSIVAMYSNHTIQSNLIF